MSSEAEHVVCTKGLVKKGQVGMEACSGHNSSLVSAELAEAQGEPPGQQG